MKTKQLQKEWKEVELRDLFELKYGSSLPKEQRKKGKIPVYGSNGIVGYHNKPITKERAIIIGRKGSIGKVNMSEGSCFPIDTTYYIDETKKPCSLKWLFYILKKLNLEYLNTAATIPGLNRRDVYQKRVLFPDLDTQKKIVSILEKTEELKRKRKESDKLTQEYLESVFTEMFSNKKISEKYWESGKLSSFIDEFIVPQRNKPKIFDGSIPWCRIEDFNGIYLSGSKSKKFVSEETIKKMNLKIYPIDSVIVSCSADLGKCAIIKKPLVTNQTFIGLVPSKKVDSLFLYYYMISKAKELNNMATGATIKYLSKRRFQQLDVDMPPISEQKKFARIVEHVEKLKEKQKKSHKEIKNLFDSLMQKAFKGELVR